MDLKLTGAVATDAERAVIAEAVPQAETVEIEGRVVRAGQAARGHRHHLLPALQAVQEEFGWISPGALDEICRRLSVPPAEAYGVATFYALLSTEPAPARVAHVCDDVGCGPFGGDALVARLREAVGGPDEPVEDFTWRTSPCLGQCDRGPAVYIQQAAGNDEVCTNVSAQDDDIRRLRTAVDPDAAQVAPKSWAPRLDGGGRLLARVGAVDPTDLDDFRSRRGFDALRSAISMGPAAVIEAVTAANLKGRGGAAFPTGVKWSAVANEPGPRFVICNADESEPGTFKDRVLLEGDPFALVEAMAIAGLAVGAEVGYVYLRGEYPLAAARLRHAIDASRRRGYLGDDVMGSGCAFDIELRRGAGAYICGEETALMESIEGRRGEPRNKPPFPTTHGLFGRPTAVNNVETLMNVPHIVLDGPDVYRQLGTSDSTGTRLFCLSGDVERAGTYEVAFGTTLRELLADAGGLRGELQAILLGGAAGGFVTADTLDMPLTFEDARECAVSLGSGVVMAFNDQVDLAAVVRRIAAFFRDETCGQCVPCRVGVVRQQESLTRLLSLDDRDGEQARSERVLLGDLDRVMTDASICGLGQTAASAVRSALQQGLV